MLGNLDAPAEHRGADAGSSSSAFRGHSFLMSSEQSMFRCVIGCYQSHPDNLDEWAFWWCDKCKVWHVQCGRTWTPVTTPLPFSWSGTYHGSCRCRPMVQLLFARMAPGMRRRAVTRLARFVTGSTLPSVLTEVRHLQESGSLRSLAFMHWSWHPKCPFGVLWHLRYLGLSCNVPYFTVWAASASKVN